MIPIRDTVRTTRRPLVALILIAANVAAFVHEVTVQADLGQRGFKAWIYTWALVPREVVLDPGPDEYVTFLTSMFLHGGILHLAGNMLYLWVFGRAVEDRLGHLAFGVFYLACGLAAAGTQFILAPMLDIPVLGASGAVAGVLGAYLVLFPGARIVTLVPVFILVYFVEVPAILFLAIWLVFQNIFPAVLSAPDAGAAAAPGIAYWAHIGGFGAGAAIALVTGDRRPRPT